MDIDLAVDLVVEPRGDVEQGGFAAAGWPQQAAELSDRDREMQALDGGVRPRPPIPRKKLPADVHAEPRGYRHRVNRRSSGAMTAYSITIMTTTNASV